MVAYGRQYDANGNRTSGGYKTGAANRLLFDGTNTFQYDGEGNRTAKFNDANQDGKLDAGDTNITQYIWDYRNRLTTLRHYGNFSDYQQSNTPGQADQSDLLLSYTYDTQNRQIRRGDDEDGAKYSTYAISYIYKVYRGNNPLLEIADSDGLGNGAANPYLLHRSLFGPDGQILVQENSSGVDYWGLPDHEGTIHDVVKRVGNFWTDYYFEYDSFGKLTGAALLGDFLFGKDGMAYDPSAALYFASDVPYEPATGQRLREDDLGYASGTSNFYVWAGNNPWNVTDHSGRYQMPVYNVSSFTTAGSLLSSYDLSSMNSNYNVLGGSLPGSYNVPLYTGPTNVSTPVVNNTTNIGTLGYQSLGGSITMPVVSGGLTSGASGGVLSLTTLGASNTGSTFIGPIMLTPSSSGSGVQGGATVNNPAPRDTIEDHPGEFKVQLDRDRDRTGASTNVDVLYVASDADKLKYSDIRLDVQVRTQQVTYGIIGENTTDTGWHADVPKHPNDLLPLSKSPLGPQWSDNPGVEDYLGSPLSRLLGACPGNGANKTLDQNWKGTAIGTRKDTGEDEVIGSVYWGHHADFSYYHQDTGHLSGKTGEPIPGPVKSKVNITRTPQSGTSFVKPIP